jgi:POT family proton-dependent oligopeptide transporter
MYYGIVGGVAVVVGIILYLARKPIRNLIGNIH